MPKNDKKGSKEAFETRHGESIEGKGKKKIAVAVEKEKLSKENHRNAHPLPVAKRGVSNASNGSDDLIFEDLYREVAKVVDSMDLETPVTPTPAKKLVVVVSGRRSATPPNCIW